MATKTRLLDPIGTAFKLILLNFEPENTRITIQDHVLILEPPDITQFITRWWYGESREDICYLSQTIIRFIEFYMETEESPINLENSFALFNGNKKNIKGMVKYICSGLEKLEYIYKKDNAALTLAYYRLLINLAINGSFNDSMLPVHMKDKQNQDFINSDKLREIWDDMTLNKLCDLFKCVISSGDNKYNNIYLRGIREILADNDKKFRDLINLNN